MPERRTILVTDDSGANRDLLCGQLSTLGFWTEAATNGEEAVRAARRLMPDLILMDVEMPVMNGHDACKQLKADPATAEIPVLMMTGFDPRPERSKMVEAGGDDLIVKPIPMRDLQVRVRALLRLKELRRDLRSTQESLRQLVQRENPTESKAPFDDRVALTAQALARLIGLDADGQDRVGRRRLPRHDHRPALPAALHRCQGARDPGPGVGEPVGPPAGGRLCHLVSAPAHRGRRRRRPGQDRLAWSQGPSLAAARSAL